MSTSLTQRAFDPLAASERQALLAAPRPKRSLPLIIRPSSERPHPPLAGETRAIDRGDRPVYAVWELTLKCDLACRHCGSRAGAARPDELTLDEALALVRALAELGVREVALIGGEVYLYEGWEEVVREIRRSKMECTMVTGGRSFDVTRARAAAAAGVQSVGVSIDGDEESHDRLRGLSGAYRAALGAIDACRQAGLQVAVNTQLNRLSVPHLFGIFDVLVRTHAHGWQLQLTVPAGRAADEPDVILQPHDLVGLFPVLAELKGHCDRAGIKLLPGNNLGYFGPYDHILRALSPSGHCGSCPAGRHGIGIEANGDIKGCPSLPTDAWVGGNVRDHRLVDIWERSLPLRYNRDRTVADLWGYCGDCYYADNCRGGCTWMSSSLFERPGNNPYCHHRALDFRRRGKRERVIRAEPAPGEPFDHARWEIVVEDDPTLSSSLEGNPT
jgi:radical SAM protein with 4Fe4S-binding SPASM domain